jgi:hypothetical protein
MPKQTWIVTVSNSKSIDKVAKELTKAGFKINEVLKEVGSITGSADPSVASKIKGIAGVADVAPDQSFDIGPPDSNTTW